MHYLISILSLTVLYPILLTFKLMMIVLGWAAVAIAIPFAKETEKPDWPWNDKPTVYEGWTHVALPFWANWAWGSDKYGARGNWFWPEYYEDTRSFKAMWTWLAWRNPVGNLTYTTLYKYNTNLQDLEWHGSSHIDDNTGQTGIRFSWSKSEPWRAGICMLLPYGNGKYFWLRYGFKQNPAYDDQAPSLSLNFNPYK